MFPVRKRDNFLTTEKGYNMEKKTYFKISAHRNNMSRIISIMNDTSALFNIEQRKGENRIYCAIPEAENNLIELLIQNIDNFGIEFNIDYPL